MKNTRMTCPPELAELESPDKRRRKKSLKPYLAWILIGTIGIGPVGSAYAAEQPPQSKLEKIRLLKRLVNEFKTVYKLYRKKKAGNASLEELRDLKLRMITIKRRAIDMGIGLVFLAAIGTFASWHWIGGDPLTDQGLAMLGSTLLGISGTGLAITQDERPKQDRQLRERWASQDNNKKINMILETYGKNTTPSPPLYNLFVSAITKNKEAIKSAISNGWIHLFDESWVWPAVVDMFYFENKATEEQVEQFKQDVNWQKWYEYWTGVEKSAHDLGLLGENETIQPLTPTEREKLATDVKHQLFEIQLKEKSR